MLQNLMTECSKTVVKWYHLQVKQIERTLIGRSLCKFSQSLATYWMESFNTMFRRVSGGTSGEDHVINTLRVNPVSNQHLVYFAFDHSYLLPQQ